MRLSSPFIYPSSGLYNTYTTSLDTWRGKVIPREITRDGLDQGNCARTQLHGPVKEVTPARTAGDA
jgi:hypothetical protein